MAYVRVFRTLPALLVISAALLGVTAASAADFPTVVGQILASQTTGTIAKMEPGKKSAMITCVIGALDPLPAGKKRYVVEGASLDEQQDRFGEVVNENHARWKKKIADACARIALGAGARDVDHVGEN